MAASGREQASSDYDRERLQDLPAIWTTTTQGQYLQSPYPCSSSFPFSSSIVTVASLLASTKVTVVPPSSNSRSHTDGVVTASVRYVSTATVFIAVGDGGAPADEAAEERTLSAGASNAKSPIDGAVLEEVPESDDETEAKNCVARIRLCLLAPHREDSFVRLGSGGKVSKSKIFLFSEVAVSGSIPAPSYQKRMRMCGKLQYMTHHEKHMRAKTHQVPSHRIPLFASAVS
ncbi:hypothetical protein HK102_011656 [Quaeritorhiza haematococci]|nr:hypothetical protein HK102_011656 [Quaeritorhiza haematococci]